MKRRYTVVEKASEYYEITGIAGSLMSKAQAQSIADALELAMMRPMKDAPDKTDVLLIKDKWRLVGRRISYVGEEPVWDCGGDADGTGESDYYFDGWRFLELPEGW